MVFQVRSCRGENQQKGEELTSVAGEQLVMEGQQLSAIGQSLSDKASNEETKGIVSDLPVRIRPPQHVVSYKTLSVFRAFLHQAIYLGFSFISHISPRE